MNGNGRPRKAPGDNPGRTPGSTQRKSLKKGEEQRQGSAKAATPAAESRKAEGKPGGRGRGAAAAPPKAPGSSAAPQGPRPRPAPRGAENKAAARSPSKRRTSADDSLTKLLQDTLERLKIRRTGRIEATKCVNEIQQEISRYLKGNLNWCKGIQELKTGSHVENVKICESDEFDVMLVVSVERVDIQRFGDDGAFYSVTMKRNPNKHPLDRFLNEDKTIRASEMLKEFRQKVKECVNKMSMAYDVTVENKKPGCPAVTLQVKRKDGRIISLDFVLGLEVHSSSWPAVTENGFKIDSWLGRKVKMDLKRKPYYLVSKYEGRGTKERDGVVAKDAWRISFSHVEKEILRNHGHSKTCCESGLSCCRKQCLKLMKFLVQRLKEEHPKEAAKLCSYHAKTTLLHACAARVEDSEWAANKLSDCFQQVLSDFEEHLRSQKLPNFFIPDHNLLKSAGLDKKACEILADRIEFQRNNGFPLFRQVKLR